MPAPFLPMLDFAIGIVVLFLGFSLMVSTVVEVIRQFLDAREKTFDETFTLLCNSVATVQSTLQIRAMPAPNAATAPNLKTSLLSQSPLASLGAPGKISHVPPDTFAKAVLGWVNASGGRAAIDTVSPLLSQVLKAVPEAASIEEQAKQDLEALEAWYRAAMDRASEAFRKSSQRWVFWIGLAVAATVDFDAIRVAQALYNNPALRTAVATQASACSKPEATDPAACKAAFDILTEGSLPLGWSQKMTGTPPQFEPWHDTLLRRTILEGGIFGWLIAAISAVVGAQVWFDALKRLITLRTYGIESKPKSATG